MKAYLAGAMGKLQAVDFTPNLKLRYTFWSGVLGGFFLAAAMTDKPSENAPPPKPESEATLDGVKLPPHEQVAA